MATLDQDDLNAIAALIPTAVQNAAAVWDRVLTGATHNVTNSAGRRLRNLGASSVIDGTASAGTANSITLSGASAVNETYDGNLVIITGGTGAGQARFVVEYNGTTKVAIVNRAWATTPDNTSEFQIIGDEQADIVQHGLAQGGTTTTITLSSDASATDDIYIGCHLFISTSVGSGQTRLITDYVGATKVATVSPAWVVTPTSASVYNIIPVGRAIVDSGNVDGITVVPLTGVVESRIDGTTISVFTGETLTVSVACVDAEGTAVDVSAMTLEIIIENQRTADIVVIANASITKVTSTFSFAVPIAVSTTEGSYRWALRKTTDDTVLMQGPFVVAYAPQGD